MFSGAIKKRIVVRNSHKRCSVKKDVLKIFANFTGKDSITGAFLWNLWNFLKISFFTEHLLWMFLTTILFFKNTILKNICKRLLLLRATYFVPLFLFVFFLCYLFIFFWFQWKLQNIGKHWNKEKHWYKMN